MRALINKFAILFITCVLVFPLQSIAFDDVCKEGGKVINMTTAQMKEYFRNNLKGDRVEGKGEVYDVITQRGFSVNANECIIIVRCKNDVFAYVNAGDYFGSKKDIVRGQKVSFTGDCTNLKWKYYRDSDKRYIEFTIKEAYVRF